MLNQLYENLFTAHTLKEMSFMEDALRTSLRDITGSTMHDYLMRETLFLQGFEIIKKVKMVGMTRTEKWIIRHNSGGERLFMKVEDDPEFMFVKICTRDPKWIKRATKFYEEHKNV